jgi:hypothetical protein
MRPVLPNPFMPERSLYFWKKEIIGIMWNSRMPEPVGFRQKALRLCGTHLSKLQI